MKALLWGVVRKALRLCGVSLPGRVTAYDRDLRRASVRPHVQLRMEDGQIQERSPLDDRPVLLPRGGGFGLWFDLEQGDPVVTLLADESTAEFYSTGQAGAPVFGQQHQPSDAIVLPGGVPDPEQQTVNGPGQCVVGTADLTSCVIFSRATAPAPDQAGKLEVRVSVRLDLGGLLGLPTARSTDPVKPDANMIAIVGAAATAANTLAPGSVTPLQLTNFAAGMGTIAERPDAKVYSE